MTTNTFTTGKILLLGATGRVGGKTLDCLRDQAPETPVRLVSRRPATVRRFNQPNTEVLVGDMTDTHTLDSMFEGVETLLLVSGDHAAMARDEIRVIEAATRYDTIRIVKISAITAGLVQRRAFGIQHGEVEDVLRSSGLPFVILRPTFFFQSLELFRSPILRGLLPAATGKGAIGFVDLEDVARAATRALLNPALDGSHHILTGPESLTMMQVAELISRQVPQKVRHISPPSLLMKPLLQFGAGLDGWLAGQVTDLMHCCARGGEDMVTDSVFNLTGRPPLSLKEYISRNRTLYST